MSLALVGPKRGVARTARTRDWLGISGRISIAVLVVFTFIAIFGRWIAWHNPASVDLARAFEGPSWGHPFGLDEQGRDVLARILAGARISFFAPLLITLATVAVGTAIAVIGAWRGGVIDSALGSFVDLMFAFPLLLLVVLAVAVFGGGLGAAILALIVASTPYLARVLRGAAGKERILPYIDALYVQGISGRRVCVRHLVPNMMPLIIAQSVLTFGYSMVSLAAISFLGFGVQEPDVDWGIMLAESRTGVLQDHPSVAYISGVCIVGAVAAFNVLGSRITERARTAASRAGGGSR